MAPSAAAPAQHRSSGRSPLVAPDAAPAPAPLVAAAAAAAATGAAAANHHQPHHHHSHHHRRAGAPLSAPPMAALGGQGGTPAMDVVHRHQRHRRTASSSSSFSAFPAPPQQSGDGRKVHLLSRSLSGSRLNAGAPSFVPKVLGLQIVTSSSLPGPGQGLGFSPPALVQAPSSVIPVIVPPPVVVPPAAVVSAASAVAPAAGALEVSVSPVEQLVSESPPGIVKVSSKDEAVAGEVVALVELGGDVEQGQGPTAAAGGKPVVTEELKAKIVKQVEFYFSDTNLPTDNYLMKFVRKDPDGFVPIPVVASFRKIKNLVKNHGVVAAALRNSTQLIVSEDGKKVRRVQPLPDVDLEEVQARTVVAENLPKDHSVESVEELFSKVGPVKMVRICSPEGANGANSTAAKHPKADMLVSNKVHALVEYESVELAEKAVTELTDERNWRSGLRVRLLLRRQAFQSKHSYQQAPHQRARKPSMDDGELAMEEEEGPAEKNGEKGHDRFVEEFSGPQNQSPRADDYMGGDAGDAMGKRGRGRGRGGRTGVGRGRGLDYTHSGTPPRMSSSYLSETVFKPPPGPRMPDGTRGFSTGRGKLLGVNTSVNSVA